MKSWCCRRLDRRQADVHRTSAFRSVQIPIHLLSKDKLTGFLWKPVNLSCERVTKRSRIEVKVSKSTHTTVTLRIFEDIFLLRF